MGGPAERPQPAGGLGRSETPAPGRQPRSGRSSRGSEHPRTPGPGFLDDADDKLRALAARHGVDTAYEPSPGKTVEVPRDTVVAVLAALDVDASTPEAVSEALDRYEERERHRLLPDCTVVRPGEPLRLALPEGARLAVETEDGGTVPVTAGSLQELPLGYHTLRAESAGRTATAPLIVVPERVPGPRGRSWGFLAQLYSVLSSRSWGMGDLADLADLAAWSGRTLGAGFLQINPLHAAARPAPAQARKAALDAALTGAGAPLTDPSPYRPSSRRFPDPVYLRIEEVPEYAYLDREDARRVDELAARAAALRGAVLDPSGEGTIDRDAVWALKREALELVRQVPLSPGRRAAYLDFVAAKGQSLDDHATWCALAETHGPNWRVWPAGLRDPRSPDVARARTEHLDLVDFHRWLAWITDAQLAAAQRAAKDAGMDIGVVHDLAVGSHPDGADAWSLQDVLATGMSVGAPPDAFNARGQDWGLPPWRPDVLAATGYLPYRDLLRGQLGNSGGLRIDHVMGLFRLWWVPEGRPPTEGTYVRYNAEAMLGVLALEAYRAGAVVIGEDLGTVEPGVREMLAERGVLGTSVLWFERDHEGDGSVLPPEAWRAACLATATTHDLPSTAARLTGEHVGLRHGLGLLTRPLGEVKAEDDAEVADWLGELDRLGLLPETPGDEEGVIRAVHRFLAATPALMVGVWLPDGVGDRRPQNLPGTLDEYPNWRLPVADSTGRPRTLEQLAADPRMRSLTESVRHSFAGSGGHAQGTSGGNGRAPA